MPTTVQVAVWPNQCSSMVFLNQPPSTPVPTPTNTPIPPSPTPTTTSIPPGQICSLVWFDQNANAVRDGEPLLNNALVTVKDVNGAVIGTRLTNGTEPYCLPNLPPGSYTITENNPNGYTSTTPDVVVVTVTPGGTQNVQFGDTLPPTPTPTTTSIPPGQICALAWFDQNANAVRDGEPLLINALLTVKDSNGAVMGTRLTNGTEPSCLPSLPPGTYTITENNPTGYNSTTPDVVVVSVTPGGTQNVQFGDTLPATPTNTPIPPGQICALAWFDQNANAVRDGEPLLINALLTVKDSNGAIMGTRLTNGTEPFCLPNLPPGNYTITENNPNGYTSTTPDVVVVSVTSGGTQNIQFGDTLPATPTNTPIPPGQVCVLAWFDQNGNANRDGEPLLINALLTIKDANGVTLGTRLTNGSEPYCLPNLPPGTYTVTENNPNGYTSTTPDVVVVTLTPGGSQTVQFGDTLPPTPTSTPIPPGQICVLAYLDQNGNATRDGEPLLVNALLTIRDPNGAVIGTRTTNGTEPYCLPNLPPGNYTVTETDPPGYISTTPNLFTITVTPGGSTTTEFGDRVAATPTPTPTSTTADPDFD